MLGSGNCSSSKNRRYGYFRTYLGNPKGFIDGTSISARLDVRETMDHIIRGVQNKAEKGNDGNEKWKPYGKCPPETTDAISLILSKPNIYQILASSKRKSENMRHFTA